MITMSNDTNKFFLGNSKQDILWIGEARNYLNTCTSPYM